MKVIWAPETPFNDSTPAFKYTDAERAEVIRALETLMLTTAVREQNETLQRVLSTHKSIEAAVVAMRKAQ